MNGLVLKNKEEQFMAIHKNVRKTTDGRRNDTIAMIGNDVWFNLEIDYDSNLVALAAEYYAYNWKYLGPVLSGKREIKAKFVSLGYVRNLDEALQKAEEMGCRLIEGQAGKSFMDRFPNLDSRGYVVFGGSEWQNQRGHACVLCLGRRYPLFHRSIRAFSRYGRWLVAGK